MKKRLSLFIGIITLIIGVNTYEAKCNDEFIVAMANEITYGFDGILAEEIGGNDRVVLSIENIPEDMYLIIVNNSTNERQTIKDIKDGMVTIETPNPNKLYDYTIKIFSSATECENEILKTVNKRSLAYNTYAKGEYCTELYAEDKFFVGCDYFTEKIYDEESFKKELKIFLEKDPDTLKLKVKDLFYKYYYFALIPIAVLGVYYTIRLALIRRRKKKDEEQ